MTKDFPQSVSSPSYTSLYYKALSVTITICVKKDIIWGKQAFSILNWECGAISSFHAFKEIWKSGSPSYLNDKQMTSILGYVYTTSLNLVWP